MISVNVTVNTPSLIKFENVFKDDSVLKSWGVVYRSFLQRRFNSYSKGGGTWQPLKTLRKRNRKAAVNKLNREIKAKAKANNTTARKRKNLVKGTRQAEAAKQTILRDTGILFNALSPNLSNNGLENIQNNTQLIIGFSYSSHNGGPSISDIASFHQNGTGNNPVREIIVPPDEQTLNKMANIVQKKVK